MKWLGLAALAVAILVAVLARPVRLDQLPEHTVDLTNGEALFWAGGCASCHATPVDGRRAKGDAKLILGGGLALNSDFGVFNVPNISPDEQYGIGGWSELDFVNAMKFGVSPSKSHYYPAFPYTSYTRMTIPDILDLGAYIQTLPAVSTPSKEHELSFPYSLRAGVGLWKRRYMSDEPVVSVPEDDALLVRGRYLVEAVGHCGECHTPRDASGGLVLERWLAGGPNPNGEGQMPDITPSSESISSWTTDDLAYYFESGFTPDFDSVGGSMVAVQESLAELTAEDRQAIAAYLKAVPSVP